MCVPGVRVGVSSLNMGGFDNHCQSSKLALGCAQVDRGLAAHSSTQHGLITAAHHSGDTAYFAIKK